MLFSAPGAESDAESDQKENHKFVTRLQCGLKENERANRVFKVYDTGDSVSMIENPRTVVTALTSFNPDGSIVVYESPLSATDFDRLRADEMRGRQPQRGFTSATHRSVLSVPRSRNSWAWEQARNTDVGYLETSWSYSRGSTPPPYVTLDNRRRPTEMAYLDYNKLAFHAVSIDEATPPKAEVSTSSSSPTPSSSTSATTTASPDLSKSLENMSISPGLDGQPDPSQNITGPLPNPWRVTSEARIRKKAREGQWNQWENIDKEVCDQNTVPTNVSHPDFFPLLGARQKPAHFSTISGLTTSNFAPKARSTACEPSPPSQQPPVPDNEPALLATVTEESSESDRATLNERGSLPPDSGPPCPRPEGTKVSKKSALYRAERVRAYNRKVLYEKSASKAGNLPSLKRKIKEEPQSE